jgi:hypothetical protein
MRTLSVLTIFAAVAGASPVAVADVCADVTALQSAVASAFKGVPTRMDGEYEVLVTPAMGANKCIVNRLTQQKLALCTWSSASNLEEQYKTMVEGVRACFPDYLSTKLSSTMLKTNQAESFETEDELKSIDVELKQEKGVWQLNLTIAVTN